MERAEGLTMTRQQMEAIAIAKGFKIAGPDHPVYKEKASIVFMSTPMAPSKSVTSMTPEPVEEMAKKLT